jgi:hypothetical protein
MFIVTAIRTERVTHIALIAVGIAAVFMGFSWVTLLICCVLFSSAIFTGVYRFLLWPVGLMLSLLFLYGSFVVASKFGASGISTRWGQVSLMCMLAVSGSWAVLRRELTKPALTVPELAVPELAAPELAAPELAAAEPKIISTAKALLISAIPISVIVVASFQLLSEPVKLVAGYTYGGDHGGHASFILGVTQWWRDGSAGMVLSNAFPVFGYPVGMHNVVAHVTVASSHTTGSHLFRVLMFAGWFDLIQFAAYVQLVGVVAIRFIKTVNWFAVIFANVAILVMMSVPNIVQQILWDGFSTSLSSAWISLVIFAISFRKFTVFKGKDVFSSYFLWVVVVGASLGLVYQLISLPFVVVTVALSGEWLLRRFGIDLRSASKRNMSIKVVAIAMLTIALVAALYWPKGMNGPVFRTFTMQGATRKPGLMYVGWLSVVTILLSISLPWLARKKKLLFDGNDKWIILPLVGVTYLIFLILMRTDQYSWTDTPYYSIKMIWQILFITMPLLVSYSILIIDAALQKSAITFRNFVKYGLVCAALGHIFVGAYTPQVAREHRSNMWFADGVSQVDFDKPQHRIIAYWNLDYQGVYVGNRVLDVVTATRLPVRTWFDGGPTEVCKFVIKEKVDEIITAQGGTELMHQAGCPTTGVTYIEGKR